MDFKPQIETLLKTLKDKGVDRSQIEEDLGYSENYIDQMLAKGGNKRFLSTLEKYVLQKATPPPPGENGQKVILDLSVLLEMIKSAQSENGRLLDVIDANLTTLASTQQIILAHVKAGHRWEAKKYGGGAEAEEKSILVQLNKFADEYLPDGEPIGKNVQGRK